jgi:hypothetical protein
MISALPLDRPAPAYAPTSGPAGASAPVRWAAAVRHRRGTGDPADVDLYSVYRVDGAWCCCVALSASTTSAEGRERAERVVALLNRLYAGGDA